MSDTPLIYQALAAVMVEVQSVAKKDRNDHQKFNFRGIDAVVNAVGPALRKHQVLVVPEVNDVQYELVQTSTGKPSTACRVHVTYKFCAVDGSQLEASVAGEAWDSGDKACPKAMSVAFRTALLQALCLPTDEPDPDASTYERAEPVKVAWSSAQRVKAALEKAGIQPQVLTDFLGREYGVEWFNEVPRESRDKIADGVEQDAHTYLGVKA